MKALQWFPIIATVSLATSLAASLPFSSAMAQTVEPESAPQPTPMVSPQTPIQITLSPEFSRMAQELKAGAWLDLYGPLPLQNAESDADRFRVRSAKLIFASKIDETFDALVNIAGRDINGAFDVTLEEGFLSSRQLLPHSEIKAGKFLLGVGRLNQVRQTDWPFPSAPKVHRQFLSDSNAIDTGLEYKWLATDWMDFAVGVTNGYQLGYSTANSGQRPLTPTHYAHPVFHSADSASGGFRWGLTYLGRTAADGTITRIAGTDFVYEDREGSLVNWLYQAEFYHRYTNLPDLPIVEELGAYLYAQKALSENWFTGLRVDGFTTPSLRTTSGDARSNLDLAFVPVVTYKASPASTIRFAYTHQRETRDGDSPRSVQLLELQLTAQIGDLPH